MGRMSKGLMLPIRELELALDLLEEKVTPRALEIEVGCRNANTWVWPRLLEAYKRNMIACRGVLFKDRKAMPLPRDVDMFRPVAVVVQEPLPPLIKRCKRCGREEGGGVVFGYHGRSRDHKQGCCQDCLRESGGWPAHD